jgi:hypothetical protein
MTTDAHLCKRNTHGNDDERIILGHVETGSQHKIQLYRAVRTRVLAHAQSGRRKEVWLAMAMKLRLRVLLLFGITGLLTLLLVLYLYTRPSDELLGPEDPRSYARGLEHIPGPDRILGSILTHILKPELSQRVEVAEADSDPGILVSVKTTTRYHQHRLSLLLFTWMKTLPPEQLYIVTDRKANDPWIREAKLAGIHVIKARCPKGHTSESLCCKSGLEYEQFYKALESGKIFRWFCHFDDDEYLNVVNLFKELKKYDSSADYYVGHWLTKHGKKPKKIGRFKFFPEAKRTRYFYATGASYCVSSGLMKKVKKYFRGKSFPVTCRKIGLTDDYTVGSVIGGVLGVNLTEVPSMLSQGEDFTHFNITQLRNMVSSLSSPIGPLVILNFF